MGREENFRRDWVLGCASACLTALSLFALGSAIYRVMPPAMPPAGLLDNFLNGPGVFRPKPAERAAYMLSLLFAPALLWGFFESLKRLLPRMRAVPRRARQASFFASLAVVALTIERAAAGDHFFYVGRTILLQPFAFAAGAAAIAALIRFARSATALNRVLGAATAALLAYGFVSRCFGSLDPYVMDRHFQAFFSSVAQTHMGRFPLVDYDTTYGLYALFLNPLFRLIGLSVFSFSVVMSLLVLLSYSLILLFLLRILRRPWIAFLGMSALIFFADFDLPNLLQIHRVLDYYDPYFQYKPLRLLFPSLAFAFVAWDRKPADSARRLAFTVVLSAGCFWNLDSGAPALLAWLLLLSFEALFTDAEPAMRSLSRIWGAAAAGLLAWWLGLSIALRLGSGIWPHWSLWTMNLRQFLLLGYEMLPMRLVHTWNILILLYAAGLLVGWIGARSGRWEARHRAVLFSALLGLGLFSYYEGRSHDFALFTVVTPGFCLMALFADRLLDLAADSSSVFSAPRAFAALLLAVFCGFALRGLNEFPFFNRSIRERLVERRQAYPGFEEDLAFLRARVPPGEPVEFLSYAEPVYYLETKTRALSGPGFAELFRKDDMLRLFRLIQATPGLKIFADRAMLDASAPNPQNFQPRLNAAVSGFLHENYRVAAVSPSGRIAAYEPR